jgi:uncharacterized membrane protein YhfC
MYALLAVWFVFLVLWTLAWRYLRPRRPTAIRPLAVAEIVIYGLLAVATLFDHGWSRWPVTVVGILGVVDGVVTYWTKRNRWWRRKPTPSQSA